MAHRYLAELKGSAKSIPNQAILIDTLALQEAKEVARYREAMKAGFLHMQNQQGLLVEHAQGKQIYFINQALVTLLIEGEIGSS